MANHLSTKKSIRQTLKRSLINKSRFSRIRTYIKKVLFAISSGSKCDAKLALIKAQSEIMKGVTKNIIKFNAGARKVSKLFQKIKLM